VTEVVTGEAVVLEVPCARFPSRLLALGIDLAIQIVLLVVVTERRNREHSRLAASPAGDESSRAQGGAWRPLPGAGEPPGDAPPARGAGGSVPPM
jgi:hypothetical protein